MFYDRFEELCLQKGVKPGRACIDMGLSRSLAAKWKATATDKPSTEALEKMSAYFDMSIDSILGNEQKETPAKTASVDDDDIKFALFGTTEIDDDTLEDIKAYARFKREQRKG